MRLHNFGRVGACKRPNHVAGTVTNICADRVVAEVNVVNQSFFQNGHEAIESRGKKETASAKFSQRQTASMPRSIRLRSPKQVVELLYNLVSEILVESHRDSANTLGSCPAHHVVVVFERVEQVLNDKLELFVLRIF